MRKVIFSGLMLMVLVLSPGGIEAGVPKISNLKFSDSPIILGEWFTISVEFEGDVDRLFIENIWETQSGEIKQELKEYTIPSDIKEKPKGVIVRQWKTVNPSVKPYRILKVWVRDANGNQSNVLSGEVKIAISEVPKAVSPTPFVLGEKCEAPIWNVGDVWTYKTSSWKTWRDEVVDDEENHSILKRGKDKIGFDKKNFNEKFIIDDKGNKTRSSYWSWSRKLFNFPMIIGKKWTHISTSEGENYLNEFKVDTIDEIITPAGTFKAYKIYCKHTQMQNTTITGSATFWYSPEVKNWIKREFDNWKVFRGFEDAVIIQFKLK
jgi:hypothetical protein